MNIHGSKGLIPWVGGKSRLANTIIPLICEHECFCEVFAGGARILFRKEPSRAEVLNDINVELVNLYRVVSHHLDEFVRCFRWLLVSRDDFERFKAANPESLTDIHRAVRFFYLVKLAFGAKAVNPTFGTSTSSKPRLNLLRIEEDLSAAHLRLQQVTIERLPYADLIERYDRPHTFFYLDPPYDGCEDDYGPGIFRPDDFAKLSAQLAGIKGRFILSINDTVEMRRVFGGFDIMAVPTRYSVGGGKAQKAVVELLVSNYRLRKK